MAIPDNAGNTLRLARDIGVLGASDYFYQDWVGVTDRNDYYRFALTQAQNLRASLTGLGADADVEVLDARGRRVGGRQGISDNGGTASEAIILDGLKAGMYYVRVSSYQNANTDYTLSLRANPAPFGLWSTEYFNNTSLSGTPALTQFESSLNHNWLMDAPANGVNSDYFSTRWTGRFNFEGGTYRFNVRTDDGMRIWIDNKLVLDRWVLQPPTDYQVFRNLTPGTHQIRVEYYEQTERAVAQLSWDRLPSLPLPDDPNKDFTYRVKNGSVAIQRKAHDKWYDNGDRSDGIDTYYLDKLNGFGSSVPEWLRGPFEVREEIDTAPFRKSFETRGWKDALGFLDHWRNATGEIIEIDVAKLMNDSVLVKDALTSVRQTVESLARAWVSRGVQIGTIDFLPQGIDLIPDGYMAQNNWAAALGGVDHFEKGSFSLAPDGRIHIRLTTTLIDVYDFEDWNPLRFYHYAGTAKNFISQGSYQWDYYI